MERFQTEEQCLEFFFKLRRTKGFICPKFAREHYCEVKTRPVCHRLKCRHQVSIIANVTFQRSHIPLKKRFSYLVQH